MRLLNTCRFAGHFDLILAQDVIEHVDVPTPHCARAAGYRARMALFLSTPNRFQSHA